MQDVSHDLAVLDVHRETDLEPVCEQRGQGRREDAHAEIVMPSARELLALQDGDVEAAVGFPRQPVQEQGARDAARASADDDDPAAVGQTLRLGHGRPRFFSF